MYTQFKNYLTCSSGQVALLMSLSIVGVVGAFIGGLVFQQLGYSGTNINDNAFNLSSLVVSFIGAVILLGSVSLLQRGGLRRT